MILMETKFTMGCDAMHYSLSFFRSFGILIDLEKTVVLRLMLLLPTLDSSVIIKQII